MSAERYVPPPNYGDAHYGDGSMGVVRNYGDEELYQPKPGRYGCEADEWLCYGVEIALIVLILLMLLWFIWKYCVGTGFHSCCNNCYNRAVGRKYHSGAQPQTLAQL